MVAVRLIDGWIKMVKVGEAPRWSLNRLPINPSPRSQQSNSMRPLPNLTSARTGTNLVALHTARMRAQRFLVEYL